VAQAASFFAQAYSWNGKTVIAYRGTETASMRRSHAGRESLVELSGIESKEIHINNINYLIRFPTVL
jgi:hypothetical protein